jgi:hypothetical protein
MSKYEYLKKYINPEDPAPGTNSFYSLSKEKISESEKKLNKVFPESLKTFWIEAEYGFFEASSSEIRITQIVYYHQEI